MFLINYAPITVGQRFNMDLNNNDNIISNLSEVLAACTYGLN
jgi:hypothetical protein